MTKEQKQQKTSLEEIELNEIIEWLQTNYAYKFKCEYDLYECAIGIQKQLH